MREQRLAVLIVFLSVVALVALVTGTRRVVETATLEETGTAIAQLTMTTSAQQTLTAAPTLTPSLTPALTPTAGPTATLAGTPADLAYWEWPVCGPMAQRYTDTFFDHYWPSQRVWPTESPLKWYNDGVGIILPWNGLACLGTEPVGTWCGQRWVTRSENRNYVEFVNRPSVPEPRPYNLVLSPHEARVLWVGSVSRLGSQQYSSTDLCQAGGWQMGVLLNFFGDEYLMMPGLSTVFVRRGDEILAGDVIGASGVSVSYNNPLAAHTSISRAMHRNYGLWYDPLGWGTDDNGYYQPYDQDLDPWKREEGNWQSQRRFDFPVARAQACPVPCGFGPYVVDVDTIGASFACATCSAAVSDPAAHGGSYRYMVPTGTVSETGHVLWTATTAPAGTYMVYGEMAWAVDTNADTYKDTQTSPAARYEVGDSLATASQKPDGPLTGGWHYLGTYTYSVNPYIRLSNASFPEESDPGLGYYGTSTCERLYVGAVMFVPQCSGPDVPTGIVNGTPLPSTATPTP